jgi:hypothetical protein
VTYLDLLAGQVALPEVVSRGDLVRIESPGKDDAVELALLRLGAATPDPEGFAQADVDALERLPRAKGLIRYPRQWYRGYCAALALVDRQRAVCPPHTLMAHPADIAAMFDKRVSHARMLAAGVAVPPALGPIAGYQQLLTVMAERGYSRVFVKLAHGSSASGVVALQTNGRQQIAVTTAELVSGAHGVQLFNSRRLRTYREPGQIAQLIDTLATHCVHVEQWLPKAGISGRTFDLRVVVIAGRVRHTVVRMSRGPLTNLHLLNERGDPAAVRARMGAAAWEAAAQTCLAAMACFPASHYAGVDLLIAPDFRRHAVLEINAFGDLLPGALDDGEETYTAEIAACGSFERPLAARAGAPYPPGSC